MKLLASTPLGSTTVMVIEMTLLLPASLAPENVWRSEGKYGGRLIVPANGDLVLSNGQKS
jgi:hypothetical protein